LGTLEVGHTWSGAPDRPVPVEWTLTSNESGFAAASRTVVSVAAGLIAGVERNLVGAAKVRTAQGNAWAAMCADRDRARARADVDALVAALVATPRPRNTAARAAHAR
jgi:hypothetical protein